MRFLLFVTLVFLFLAALPVLSGQAGLPASLQAHDVGAFFGDILRYWAELFGAAG